LGTFSTLEEDLISNTMETTFLYPLAEKEQLRKQFVGKSIKDVDTPAAILDLSKVQKNCSRMLEACELLKMGWRAHIKTHKVAWSTCYCPLSEML